MKPDANTDRLDIETLTAVIAHSQIVVSAILSQLAQSHSLPAEFDDADIAILEWIAAEGRRSGRALVRI